MALSRCTFTSDRRRFLAEAGIYQRENQVHDEPLGDLKDVRDFLPHSEELVFRDEGVRVTIALSKRSVDFFKGEARKHHTQYQRITRRLLDTYAEHHSGGVHNSRVKLSAATSLSRQVLKQLKHRELKILRRVVFHVGDQAFHIGQQLIYARVELVPAHKFSYRPFAAFYLV